MVKKYKKDIINKAKAELKEAKVKAKNDAKLAKLKEKEEAKEVKRKAKEEKVKETKIKKKSKTLEENIVLGPTTITMDENVKVDQLENTGCVEILKSGPNKGNNCGCKIVSNNRCKRHIPHSTA